MNPREFIKQYEGKVFAFGIALQLLKAGYRVRRDSWPMGRWVTYQKGYPDGIAINRNTAEASGIAEGTVCKFLPYLMMKNETPESSFVNYIPGTQDLLEEDWTVTLV